MRRVDDNRCVGESSDGRRCLKVEDKLSGQGAICDLC